MDKTIIKRRWIIVHQPGMIPDKKGPFRGEDDLKRFLDELVAHSGIEGIFTIVSLTKNDDIWVDLADEWLLAYALAAPRKARAEDPFSGLRIQVRQRLHATIRHLKKTGALNRSDIMRIGEVSGQQASADINLIKQRFPGLMTYDSSAKCYFLARTEGE